MFFYKRRKILYGATVLFRSVVVPNVNLCNLALHRVVSRWRASIRDFDERFLDIFKNLKIVFCDTKEITSKKSKIFVDFALENVRDLIKEMHKFVVDKIMPRAGAKLKDLVVKRMMR